MTATRVAALDIGTNTVRLLVADVGPGDMLVERERRVVVTRLGQGVDATGRLAPEAIARTLAALRELAAAAAPHAPARRLAVGTSAVREAEDGEAFRVAVEEATGFPMAVVGGEEEGRLTHRGVASGADLRGRVAVIDVGGGSTEITVGEGGAVAGAASVRAGSVRATERWLGEGRVRASALVEARRDLDALLLRDVPDALVDGLDGGVAVAATATILAALDLGLDVHDRAAVDGHLLGALAVEALVLRLAGLEHEARAALGAVGLERAGVIVGGALVLAAALRRTRLDAVRVSARDVLDGIALAAADG